MKNGRFEVGDRVVANAHASGRYSITTAGWKGKVISVKLNYDIKDSDISDTIEVKGPGGSWWVNHTCFDFVEKSVTIKGVSLPDCCGICFAYNRDGCAFINLDKSTNIWSERAKNCPMREE